MGDHRFNPFAQNNVVGAPELLDAFNRPISVGDLMTLAKPLGLVTFRVAEIIPNLAPNAPPRSLRVVLFAQLTLTVPANKKTPELVIVLRADEQEGGRTSPPTESSPTTDVVDVPKDS